MLNHFYSLSLYVTENTVDAQLFLHLSLCYILCSLSCSSQHPVLKSHQTAFCTLGERASFKYIHTNQYSYSFVCVHCDLI